MFKYLAKKSQKTGLPPGTLSYIGEESKKEVLLELIEYNETSYNHHHLENIASIDNFKNSNLNKWFIVKGIHDTNIIKELGKHFNINTLTLEDLVNTFLFPKVEYFDNYVFIVLKVIDFNNETLEIETDQISVILGIDYLISFQETETDILTPIIKRLENNTQFKRQKHDYLFYTILDLLVDLNFKTLEQIGDKIEIYEDELLFNPSRDLLKEINKLKSTVILLRSIFRPLKNLIKTMDRFESPLIADYLHIYLRDVSDHINQLCEILEVYREMISHLMDMYLSSANNKMSEIMKILTIMASIFIPLTFIAGVYGMNFDYMPELSWHYGYYTVLSVMGATFIIMVLFFRHKKWL